MTNISHMENHLKSLSQVRNFPTDHVAYLEKLKQSGFEPRVIYDIGCCVLHWTHEAERLWPDAQIILFDAFKEAEFLWQDYSYHLGILSDVSGETVKFYKNTQMPGGNSYYKERNDSVFPPNAYEECITRTLDDIVKEKGFPPPDLVKIDCQGAEKDIVTGGINTLKQAKHLIIEMQSEEYNIGAPKVNETLPYIESILGVKCVAPLFCNNGPDGDYGFQSGI